MWSLRTMVLFVRALLRNRAELAAEEQHVSIPNHSARTDICDRNDLTLPRAGIAAIALVQIQWRRSNHIFTPCVSST